METSNPGFLHRGTEHTDAVLKTGDTAVTADQVKAFVLNIRYDGTVLTLVTGCAFHTFLMDKTPDALWDRAVRLFLEQRKLPYEEA
ncbi:MAG: DUF5721 family protein [bacterium]|nr:DUF5721 family protein [bacterium]